MRRDIDTDRAGHMRQSARCSIYPPHTQTFNKISGANTETEDTLKFCHGTAQIYYSLCYPIQIPSLVTTFCITRSPKPVPGPSLQLEPTRQRGAAPETFSSLGSPHCTVISMRREPRARESRRHHASLLRNPTRAVSAPMHLAHPTPA